MFFSKTLDKADYSCLKPQVDHILRVRDKLHGGGAAARFEHEHRAWEYALVMRALLENHTRTVLDVGGGASVFAPAWKSLPFKNSILQVDPGIEMAWIPKQEDVISKKLPFLNIDFLDYKIIEPFDGVVCLSTIEHVPEDFRLFNKLLVGVASGGLLAVTFDFHPSGKALVGGHIRTYNATSIYEMLHMAEDVGFEVYGDGVDYTWRGPDVFDYTFGALILKRMI